MPRIEIRREKLVLIDQSVSGTYVAIAGRNEIGLRREELALCTRGQISLGHRAGDEEFLVVKFVCG